MKQRQKRLGDYYILLISVGHLFCVITAETLLTLSQKEKESLPPCDDPPKHVRQSVFYVRGCLMNIWTGLNNKIGRVQKVYE